MTLSLKSIVLAILVTIVLVGSAQALKPANEYELGQCELIAKDYMNEYNGYLVMIQPLKENGAFDFGAYNGHLLNRAYSKDRGIYYIDYYAGLYFNNTIEISTWYEDITGQKNIVYDFAIERPSWGIIWHY